MKTEFYHHFKLAGLIFLALTFTQGLRGQTVSLLALDQSKKLAGEYDALSLQAEILRKNATKTSGDDKVLFLDEATALEKQALQKKVQSLSLSYNYYKKQSSDRSVEIAAMQKSVVVDKHKMQTKFLLDESAKNARQAELLYQEGITVNSPAYAAGILENADEKMLLAVKQKEEIVVLLKDSINDNYASKK